MSVEVQIPLRLTIDPALSGQEIGAELSHAVDAAVYRALDELDREIIQPRAGYAWPVFNAPEFAWTTGDRALEQDWRAGIEADVRRALANAVARAPNSAAERLANAPEVMPDNPAERFDARRLRGDDYLLPSYDGDIPAPDVPVSLQAWRTTPAWNRARMLRLWTWAGSDAGLIVKIRSFLNSLPEGAISTGVLGVMYLSRAGSNGGLMRIAVLSVGSVTAGAVSASLVRTFVLGGFEQIGTDDGDNDMHAVNEDAVSEASIVRGRAIQGVADGRAAARDYFLGRLGLPLTPADNEDEVAAATRDFARRVAQNFQVRYPDGFFARFILLGGQTYACTIPARSFSGQVLQIRPIYSLVERPVEGEEGEGAGQGGGGQQGDGQGGGGDGDATGTGDGGGTGDGTGTGDGGGDGAGDAAGTGPGGDGDGPAAPPLPGSPLADPDADPGEGAARFYPVVPGGEVVEIDLGPFEGEPGLDALGELGDMLRRLMQRIAFRLEMPMGKYAGSFCIGAAQMIGVRAAGVAGFAEMTPRTTHVVAAGTGNLGDVQMPASQSPAITVMRHIGATVPLLTRLQRLMIDIYNIPAMAALITGRRHADPVGWGLDFYKAYSPKMNDSVGYLFIRSCQIKMLELLRNSAREIDARLANFDSYYPMVRSMILGMVASEADLNRLRDKLQQARADRGEFGAKVSETYRDWRSARHALSTSLSGQILNLSALTASGDRAQAEIVETPQGLRVRDGDGRTWSEDELNQAISFRHNTAASIDPLIHQFRDIPEVVQAFQQSPTLSRAYLRALLEEMRDKNREITTETISNDMFAFRVGKIREDLPGRTIPYTDLALQGIHLLTHEAIGDAFGGARAYALGVQYVFNVEQGRQMLMVFGETVSVIALAVICPPAAAALGAVFAGIHYSDAAEIDTLYGALIDPELILNRAEVEFDLFLAGFEIALSVLPEAGALIRLGSSGVRVGMRSGLRAGARSLGRRARRQLMVSVGRQIKTGIANHVVREVLTDRAMTLILPHLLGPVMNQIHREISVLSGQPVPPEAAGTPAVPELLSEDEQALIRRLEEYQEGDRREDLPDAGDAP